MNNASGASATRAPFIEQALAPIIRFSHVEASGGIVLIACTVIALVWANSPYAPSYAALWATHVTLGFGDFVLSKTLLHWINDGLMAVFFFTVGLEIKREILVGELNSPSQAVLPVAAAVGGMAVPAAIYAAVNHGLPSLSGWGVPMATDIAFALGILSLLGNRVPASLKVFLAAVAIVDDIGAVLVIAVFYSGDISLFSLLLGGGMLLAMLAANAMGVRHPAVYTILGVVLWLAFLKSGVHATIAGVLAAMTIPARTRIPAGAFAARARRLLGCFERAGDEGQPLLANKAQIAALEEIELACRKAGAPLSRIEHALHPFVAYAVMPVFALANAGVAFGGEIGGILGEPVAVGIVLGLVIGKLTGIFGVCLAMFTLGWARLAPGVRLRHYAGVACLAGIGFTMSIFIAGLAFGDQSTLDAKAKLAVLAASTASGVIGFIVLRLAGDGADGGECLQEPVDPETSCPGVPGPCGGSPSS